MSDNDYNDSPYAAPRAELQSPASIEVPKDILKKIRVGWIAAVITGAMTLVMMLIAINTDVLNEVFDIWSSVDVVLVFGLAYGIYRKSRIAASSMFVYFLISKIILIMESGQPGGMVITVLFIYFYFRAMIATFQYHAYLRSIGNNRASGE